MKPLKIKLHLKKKVVLCQKVKKMCEIGHFDINWKRLQMCIKHLNYSCRDFSSDLHSKNHIETKFIDQFIFFLASQQKRKYLKIGYGCFSYAGLKKLVI